MHKSLRKALIDQRMCPDDIFLRDDNNDDDQDYRWDNNNNVVVLNKLMTTLRAPGAGIYILPQSSKICSDTTSRTSFSSRYNPPPPLPSSS